MNRDQGTEIRGQGERRGQGLVQMLGIYRVLYSDFGVSRRQDGEV